MRKGGKEGAHGGKKKRSEKRERIQAVQRKKGKKTEAGAVLNDKKMRCARTHRIAGASTRVEDSEQEKATP